MPGKYSAFSDCKTFSETGSGHCIPLIQMTLKLFTIGYRKVVVAESNRQGGKAGYFLWIYPAIPSDIPMLMN